MKNAVTLSVFLIFSLIILSGCSTETVSKVDPSVDSQINEIDKTAIFNHVVSGSVMAFAENWDADAEDDGLKIYPKLNDPLGEPVKFDNYELPVHVEIYELEYQGYDEVKGRLLFEGDSIIDSWEDGNFMFNGGIKLSFEDIASTEETYGMIYTTTKLPDGREIEAKETGVRLKAE